MAGLLALQRQIYQALYLLKPQLEFYISGENLGDKQYVECGYSASSLYPSMGRLIMAGLTAYF